jgi:ABC-type cobalamin transport system ATPase subunit
MQERSCILWGEWRRKKLLARIAGLTTGREITLLGHSLAQWSPVSLAHRRGYLVQQQVPPFAMPVWHYLTLHLHDKSRTALLEEVAALGLEDKLSRNASQLSGGENVCVRRPLFFRSIRRVILRDACCCWTSQ